MVTIQMNQMTIFIMIALHRSACSISIHRHSRSFFFLYMTSKVCVCVFAIFNSFIFSCSFLYLSQALSNVFKYFEVAKEEEKKMHFDVIESAL